MGQIGGDVKLIITTIIFQSLWPMKAASELTLDKMLG